MSIPVNQSQWFAIVEPKVENCLEAPGVAGESDEGLWGMLMPSHFPDDRPAEPL